MFVATKASRQKGIAPNSHVSTTFHTRAKKRAVPEGTEPPPAQTKSQKTDLPDMKKLRYEIIKFGTSGFSGTCKENANVAFMVSLGAEPPKKKRKNYKEILMEKKKSDQSQESSLNPEKNLPSLKKGTKTGARKNRKDVKGLLNVYGQVNMKSEGWSALQSGVGRGRDQTPI
ncbi:UNVERIFIED_CONTAM: hypothetical protein PYX00_004128 [Menopon gallinae]|uniref:Uncharacterized protein n=1 Tax=Menopon gallinae TaxID=328185 RepID=A0AAW2I4F4_9NEOP